MKKDTLENTYIVNPSYFKEGGLKFRFTNGQFTIATIYVFEEYDVCTSLEYAASKLAEVAPGLLSSDTQMAQNYTKEELAELQKEGNGYPDHTYTESGYLESWSWFVDEIADDDPAIDLAREITEAEFEDNEIALSRFLDCSLAEAESHISNDDYLSLTDQEADENALECVTQSLWAFNASFLARQTEMPIEIFQALQDNDMCESNNDAVLACIEKTCGIQEFYQEAVRYDGRAHFMATYDSEENEETVNGETYYIFRLN